MDITNLKSQWSVLVIIIQNCGVETWLRQNIVTLTTVIIQSAKCRLKKCRIVSLRFKKNDSSNFLIALTYRARGKNLI